MGYLRTGTGSFAIGITLFGFMLVVSGLLMLGLVMLERRLQLVRSA